MADKGGNVVVMTDAQYRRMCMDILSNRQWYKLVNSIYIDKFQRDFKDIVITACADGIISDNTKKFLLIDFPVVPTFYYIPKVHKSITDPHDIWDKVPYIQCKQID